jgi:hypothetical protein
MIPHDDVRRQKGHKMRKGRISMYLATPKTGPARRAIVNSRFYLRLSPSQYRLAPKCRLKGHG